VHLVRCVGALVSWEASVYYLQHSAGASGPWQFSAHVGERQVQCVYGHASAALSLAVVCRDARVWQPLALPAWGSAVLHLCAGAAQPLMRSMCTSRGDAQRCSSFRCLQLRYACVVIEHRRVWECAELAHVLCLIVGMF